MSSADEFLRWLEQISEEESAGRLPVVSVLEFNRIFAKIGNIWGTLLRTRDKDKFLASLLRLNGEISDVLRRVFYFETPDELLTALTDWGSRDISGEIEWAKKRGDMIQGFRPLRPDEPTPNIAWGVFVNQISGRVLYHPIVNIFLKLPCVEIVDSMSRELLFREWSVDTLIAYYEYLAREIASPTVGETSLFAGQT